MNMKISWYREVLELEPDSRLFLPLARLLVEEGELDEACAILREGIKRHPSFLEARLAYVDVLRRAGRGSADTQEGTEQLDRLIQTLAAHDGFWQAWAAGTASRGEEDTSLAIRLLALAMRGVKLDLSDILRRGIESLEAECEGFDLAGKMGDQMPAAHTAAPAADKAAAPAAAPVSATPLKAVSLAAALQPAAAAVAAPVQGAAPEEAQQDETDIPLVLSSLLDPGLSAESAEPDEAGAFAEEDGMDSGDDGPWPPRTVTMAEVLAEQGDIDGACDIYAELVSRAASADEARRFAARREELLARSRAEEAQQDQPEEQEEAAPAAAPAREAVPQLGPESLGMLNALVNSLQSRVQ